MEDHQQKMTESNNPHLDEFLRSLEHMGTPMGLFHSALLISAVHYPDLKPGWWRAWHSELDELVGKGMEKLSLLMENDQEVALKELLRIFAEDWGYGGDMGDYHAPENSCMVDVLSNRSGLPITLSILLSAIGNRLGFRLFGIGAPGHFLTGVMLKQRTVYIDAFSGTGLMSQEEAAKAVALLMNSSVSDIVPYLIPMEPVKILTRVLNNLKVSYLNTGEANKLFTVMDWLLELDPNNAIELRNRGLLRLRAGKAREGAADLLRYLQLKPEASDLDVIRREAKRALRESKE